MSGRLARENAEFYIATGEATASAAGRAEFFASGRRHAEWILAETAPWRSGRCRALEIGCGVGRVALPMASHFETVLAIDVAPTMLAALRRNCRERGIENIVGLHVGEPWEDRGPIDFAWSFLVFQHIERWEKIAEILTRLASALAAGGVAYLHFDTRPANLCYRLRNRLPEALLPRTQRRGIRRIRRRGEQIEELLARLGLAIVARPRPASAADTFIVQRGER